MRVVWGKKNRGCKGYFVCKDHDAAVVVCGLATIAARQITGRATTGVSKEGCAATMAGHSRFPR